MDTVEGWSVHYVNSGRKGGGWRMVFRGEEQKARKIFQESPRSALPKLYDPEGKLADFNRPTPHSQRGRATS